MHLINTTVVFVVLLALGAATGRIWLLVLPPIGAGVMFAVIATTTHFHDDGSGDGPLAPTFLLCLVLAFYGEAGAALGLFGRFTVRKLRRRTPDA